MQSRSLWIGRCLGQLALRARVHGESDSLAQAPTLWPWAWLFSTQVRFQDSRQGVSGFALVVEVMSHQAVLRSNSNSMCFRFAFVVSRRRHSLF